jgi:hypothetical protein
LEEKFLSPAELKGGLGPSDLTAASMIQLRIHWRRESTILRPLLSPFYAALTVFDLIVKDQQCRVVFNHS